MGFTAAISQLPVLLVCELISAVFRGLPPEMIYADSFLPAEMPCRARIMR